MSTQTSSAHFFLSWAKERIDEMDATLASLEGKAVQIQAADPDSGRSIHCRR